MANTLLRALLLLVVATIAVAIPVARAQILILPSSIQQLARSVRVRGDHRDAAGYPVRILWLCEHSDTRAGGQWRGDLFRQPGSITRCHFPPNSSSSVRS